MPIPRARRRTRQWAARSPGPPDVTTHSAIIVPRGRSAPPPNISDPWTCTRHSAGAESLAGRRPIKTPATFSLPRAPARGTPPLPTPFRVRSTSRAGFHPAARLLATRARPTGAPIHPKDRRRASRGPRASAPVTRGKPGRKSRQQDMPRRPFQRLLRHAENPPELHAGDPPEAPQSELHLRAVPARLPR